MLMVPCQCGCGIWLKAKCPKPVSKYAHGHKPYQPKKEHLEDEAPREVLWTQ